MRTTVVQSVEISTLKMSADLPIQIRIRRSTSGQAVWLRNAIPSPSHTSAVDRRSWRASAKYVTRAPIVICRREYIDRAISAVERPRQVLPRLDHALAQLSQLSLRLLPSKQIATALAKCFTKRNSGKQASRLPPHAEVNIRLRTGGRGRIAKP